MKVLFVCRQNVGRSQLAEAIFERLSVHESGSAGTTVGDEDGWTIGYTASLPDREAALHLLRVAREEGLAGFDQRVRNRVTAELVEQADRVIVTIDGDPIPDFMVPYRDKLEFWDIADGKGQSYEFQLNMKNQVKQHVEQLVKEIG